MFNAKYSKVTTSIFAIVLLANITPAQAQLFPSQPRTEPQYDPPSRREPSRTEPQYDPPSRREPSRTEPQYDPPSRRDRTFNLSPNTVPRGFVIPVEYDEEKILVTPEETVPVSLYVAADIKDDRRNILIPYGSEIIGAIRPDYDQTGSYFEAEELIFPDGTTQSIDAVSQVVTRTETVKKGANAKDILQGAAIGAAAATVLSEIFGQIDFLEVLGGAGAGAIAGVLLGGNEVELVSIDPNNDLNLTLQTDLALR